jgi:ABC-type branched-subunit amino acid transport system permease subunit
LTESHYPVERRGKFVAPAIYAGVLIVVLLLPLFIKSPYLIHVFILALIYIIATASLRFIFLSGQISMGHAGFMSIGAYTAAVLAKELGWAPWVTIPLGGLTTMAIAILVGMPFSRLRAVYFSIISLFFGIAILAINSALQNWTGGYSGLIGIPPLFIGSKVPSYYFFVGLAVVSLLIMRRLEFSRIGVTLKAIDQSHVVASSVGINEAWYRIFALAVGCFFVGIAGAAFAHYSTVLAQSSFDLLSSIDMVVYMLVGGLGNFAGPIVGAAVLIVIPEVFRGLKEYVPFLFAGILILVIFVMPQGLTGLPGQIAALIKERKERRSGKKVVTRAP